MMYAPLYDICPGSFWRNLVRDGAFRRKSTSASGKMGGSRKTVATSGRTETAGASDDFITAGEFGACFDINRSPSRNDKR
jgi:hypothetical protein